jgi:hypothetical protein
VLPKPGAGDDAHGKCEYEAGDAGPEQEVVVAQWHGECGEEQADSGRTPDEASHQQELHVSRNVRGIVGPPLVR